MNLNIYVKNGEGYTEPKSIYDYLTVYVTPKNAYNAASIAYKQQITISGTVNVTGLAAKDNLILANGTLSRVWDFAAKNTLTISNGSDTVNIRDYFATGGSADFKYNGGDLPVTMDVTLNTVTSPYEFTDFIETIHGSGKVSANNINVCGNDKDRIIDENPTFTRINGGNLKVGNI
jgi:hypothetical protein